MGWGEENQPPKNCTWVPGGFTGCPGASWLAVGPGGSASGAPSLQASTQPQTGSNRGHCPGEGAHHPIIPPLLLSGCQRPASAAPHPVPSPRQILGAPKLQEPGEPVGCLGNCSQALMGSSPGERLPWRLEEHDHLGNNPVPPPPPSGLYPEVPLAGGPIPTTARCALRPDPWGRASAAGTSPPTSWREGRGEAELGSLALSLHTPPQTAPGWEAGRKAGCSRAGGTGRLRGTPGLPSRSRRAGTLWRGTEGHHPPPQVAEQLAKRHISSPPAPRCPRTV